MFLSCNRKREAKTHFYFSFSISYSFLLVFIKFFLRTFIPIIILFGWPIYNKVNRICIMFLRCIMILFIASRTNQQYIMIKKESGRSTPARFFLSLFLSVFTPVYCSHPDSSTATSTNLRTSRLYHTVLPSQAPSSQGLHPNSRLRYRLHGEA